MPCPAEVTLVMERARSMSPVLRERSKSGTIGSDIVEFGDLPFERFKSSS